MTKAAPLLTLLVCVDDSQVSNLATTLDSLAVQSEENWECLVLTSTASSTTVERIAASIPATSGRVRVRVGEHESRSAALNGVLRDVRGTHVGLLDAGDRLSPDALACVNGVIADHDTTDFVYSDDETRDWAGNVVDTFIKPTWSPERLRGHMYTGRLAFYRTSLVVELGGFSMRLDSAREHDLALRVSERARFVAHLPRVLYTRVRRSPSSAGGDGERTHAGWEAGRAAVQEHMDRLGLKAVVTRGHRPGTYSITRVLDPTTSVSVVIPTRGSSGLVWGTRRCFVLEAVRSVLEHTKHEALEVVVVHDSDTPAAVLDALREIAGAKLVLVEYRAQFNFSEKCNVGFLASSGDVVVMLNDDVEVISDGMIEQLAAPLEELDVGMVGARLHYADSTIQHAGHAYYGRVMVHPFAGTPTDDAGDHDILAVNHEMSGLTAACVALRRSTFIRIGGFCEELPVNFNDVDFSLKVRHIGLRNIWLADVRLFHFESRTRDRTTSPWEAEFVYNRWDIEGEDAYVPFLDRT